MKRFLLWSVLLCCLAMGALQAQSNLKPFPEGVFAARTVAIVNDTKQPGVEKGAVAALATWGQLKVVDDPQVADIVLRFEKTGHHDGHDTTKKNDTDSSTSYGYEMSFSATTSMKAYFKDDDSPFFSTRTEDGKTKAGSTCIDALHTAWRTAAAQHRS